jgi:hypothetical protein
MAFAAVGALVAGQAATTALVLAAVTEVGLAMTVVGTLTGSKSLVKIGGVLSLVGGVGGMIAGASSGAAGAALSESATGSALEAASAEAMGAYGGAAAAEASQVAGLSAMGAEGAVAGMGADVASMAGEALATLGETAATVTEALPAAVDVVKAAPMEAVSEAASTAVASAPEPLIGQQSSNFLGEGVKSGVPKWDAASQLPQANSKDYFSNFMKWVKDNKEVAKIGLEGVKGMVGSDLEDAKTDYYKNEANRYKYGNTVARYNPQPLIGAGA